MNATEKQQFAVSVAAHLCKGCGYCADVCPKSVLAPGSALNASGYAFMTVVQTDACVGCHACMMVCPDFAVTVRHADDPV